MAVNPVKFFNQRDFRARRIVRKHLVLIISCCVLILFSLFRDGFSANIQIPITLKNNLSKSGIPQKEIQACFKAPFDKIEVGIILKNVTHKETLADYRRFLTEKTLRKARKYLLKHVKIFSEIEQTFHVPKEVIVSILLVESSFGENGGNYPVLSVYTSLASLSDKDVRKKIRRIAAKAGEDVRAKRFRRRLDRKAKWGFKELRCLIRLKEERKIDLSALRGSWAGAFGMPQFIPTSFDAYGVDWDGDGRVNLDSLQDAAASAANYLYRNGWKKFLAHKEALRIIKFYNLSHPYATTILGMSEKLKKTR